MLEMFEVCYPCSYLSCIQQCLGCIEEDCEVTVQLNELSLQWHME